MRSNLPNPVGYSLIAFFCFHSFVFASFGKVLSGGKLQFCSERIAREAEIEKIAKNRIIEAVNASGGRETDNAGYTEVYELAELPGAFVSISYRQLLMNLMFTRMSIFSEGDGDIAAGTVVPQLSSEASGVNAVIRFDHELVRGWNIPGKAVREFFEKTLAKCSEGKKEFCLNEQEQEFYDAVYLPTLSKRENFYVVAYSLQTVGSSIFVTGHELLHVQYDFNKDFQRIVAEYWATVPETDKAEIRTTLTAIGYNVTNNEELARNEFQAFLLQPGAEVGRLSKFVPTYAPGLKKALSDGGVKLLSFE